MCLAIEKKVNTPGGKESMNFREAAIKVLLDEGTPLHYEEITRLAIERGYLIARGKTPQDSVSTELSRDMRLHGEKSVFEKCGKGTYGLKKDAPLEVSDSFCDSFEEPPSSSGHMVL
jgi:hypothetical protein